MFFRTWRNAIGDPDPGTRSDYQVAVLVGSWYVFHRHRYLLTYRAQTNEPGPGVEVDALSHRGSRARGGLGSRVGEDVLS